MRENEESLDWAKRFEAIGRAQARYLWVVLVVTLFYFALQ